MASTPPSEDVRAAEDAGPRRRSVGEHVFLWIAWALAAAFWSATLTVILGILRDAARPVAAPSAPGAPGGMVYLAFVVIAFLIFALTMAYGYLRTLGSVRGEARREAGTAALYDLESRRSDQEISRGAPFRDTRRGDLR